MKGATALPWTRISKPPKSTIIRMIGNSQNFFRARKNAHISMTNDIYYTSELIFHCIGCRARRCSINPVRFLIFFEAESQDIFPCKAHYQTGWRDDTKKH